MLHDCLLLKAELSSSQHPAFEKLEQIELFLDLHGTTSDDHALTVLPPDGPQEFWSLELCVSMRSESFTKYLNFKHNILDCLKSVLGSEIIAIKESILQQEDWITKSLEGLPCVRIGRTVIHGQHTRNCVRPGDFPIEIEAALAFGTGHHETTYGCLDALNYIEKSHSFAQKSEADVMRKGRVLDVGTGTGILAMAAAQRKNYAKVVAGDIDPEAIKVARANAQLNGLERRLFFYTGPATRSLIVKRMMPFDLIFANVLAGPLRHMAHHLCQVLENSGFLILSGLLNREVSSIVSVYRNYGVRPHKIFRYNEWAAVLFKKDKNTEAA
jgi:ribosomal protein L11 methyltransferase